MSSRPRWFYCKGWPWRVVRRPDRDGEVLEAWAVYRGGNVRPEITLVAPGERSVRERMEAAVQVAAHGVEPAAAPVRPAGAPAEAQA